MTAKTLSNFIVGAFFIKLFTAALSLAVYGLYARLLGAEGFGLLALTLSLGLLMGGVAKLGLENVMLRFGPQFNAENLSRLYGVGIAIVIISNFVIILFFVFFLEALVSWFNITGLEVMLPFIAVNALLNSLLAVNVAVLNALLKARLSLIFSGLMSNTLILLNLLIFKPGNPVDVIYIVLWCYALTLLITYCVSFYYCLPKFNGLKKLPITTLFRANQRFFIISISAIVTQQLASVLVAKYADLAEVGLLSIALKIAMLLSYPLLAVNAVCAPRYAKLSSQANIYKIKELANKTRWVLTLLASVGLFLIFIFIEPVLLLLGQEYVAAAMYVKILAIGQWINLSTGSVVVILLMTGHERLHKYQNLVITILFLILLWLTIPIYGAVAAAVLTAISISAKNLLSSYYVNKRVFKVNINDF
ncbi:oligosaccharide flippase family protein [Pseudoalteromonas sp. TB64]|uniref:oligosaccharide flippase family protein n=1 Tax=Pseudoalteromonas sp. TB64 TaxID=1938600 RepID=UPI00041B6A15|nr:oligosaccharide flippase family protein [Pseudoalteromonas sp. TB64]